MDHPPPPPPPVPPPAVPPVPPVLTSNTTINKKPLQSNTSESLADILARRKARNDVATENESNNDMPHRDTSDENVKPSNNTVLTKVTCKLCNSEMLECLYDSHITSHCNEMLPEWLYLGAERNAKEVWRNNKEQFTHVISVAEEVPRAQSNEGSLDSSDVQNEEKIHDQQEKQLWVKLKIGEIYQYHVAIKDLPGQDLRVFTDMADEIHRIKQESTNTNLKILVHCVQGISRSTSVILAYLIKYQNMMLRRAYDYVRERRSIANPRKEFVEELQNIEKNVFGCEKPTLLVEDTLVGSVWINVDPIM